MLLSNCRRHWRRRLEVCIGRAIGDVAIVNEGDEAILRIDMLETWNLYSQGRGEVGVEKRRWRKRELYIHPRSWSGCPVMNIPKLTIFAGTRPEGEGVVEGEEKGKIRYMVVVSVTGEQDGKRTFPCPPA